jgi:hypothetical protein
MQCHNAVLLENEKNNKEILLINQENDEKNYQLFQDLMVY